MKRTPDPSKRRATASTTSTTGPQVRLAQNFGVEKVTTNGSRLSTAWRIDVRRSVTSGGIRVVIEAASPPALASVGVTEAGARSPTRGAEPLRTTSTLPT